MNKITMLKKYFNSGRILFYTFFIIFFLMCFRADMVQQAIGAESQDEPYISLKVNNRPLSDVLKIITSDTGFRFKLNGDWNSYPVNASFENISLNRALKIILQGLNHVIIYDSNKSIKIVVYGEVDSDKTGSHSTQPFSSRVQDDQPEVSPSSESSPEETDDLQRGDDSSEETGPLDNTEDSSAETEESSDGGKEESSEESDKAGSNESDQNLSDEREDMDKQNEPENAVEELRPEDS